MAAIPTIAEAGRRIADGTLSPLALIEGCLARIEAHDDKLDAFHAVFAQPRLALFLFRCPLSL